uniref:Uncharacterized protein n=1 Tax=Leersia perrieri TaxID=77586 RepID=A0A0D9XPG6_9ORYZ
MHLTPWDLPLITIDYIQKGILLPNPSPEWEKTNAGGAAAAVEHLASSFARALGRFYPMASRLAAAAADDDPPSSITVSLCCNDSGAEFVHAVAHGVAVADIAIALYTPRVVWSFFPMNGMLAADAVVDCTLPVLAAQSIKKLKARANAEMSGESATISSLQSLLAHLWRGVCRARRLSSETETKYMLLIGCRGRIKGIPHAYLGNAVAARGMAAAWPAKPSFMMNANLVNDAGAMGTGSSPRFDVYGNDFGWGPPAAGRAEWPREQDRREADGVRGTRRRWRFCLAPDAVERLIADDDSEN